MIDRQSKNGLQSSVIAMASWTSSLCLALYIETYERERERGSLIAMASNLIKSEGLQPRSNVQALSGFIELYPSCWCNVLLILVMYLYNTYILYI